MPHSERALIAFAAGAAVLILSLAGCTTATSPEREMATAQQRWAAHGPTDYHVTIMRSCECLPAMSGPVRVEVRGGSVASRQYVATGDGVAPEFTALFPTVPGLFELIADARHRGAAQVRVTYDPLLGYPVRIAVDYDATTVDDEVVSTASDLQPL